MSHDDLGCDGLVTIVLGVAALGQAERVEVDAVA